jgi:hypothetical protein
MRSGHRPSPMLLAAAMSALASPAFLGAQRVRPDGIPIAERHASFDPFALLRAGGSRGGRGTRRPNRTTWSKPHCGHKQAAKYAKQGPWINVHFERRMAWNDEVLPRVLEARVKNDELQRGLIAFARGARLFGRLRHRRGEIVETGAGR